MQSALEPNALIHQSVDNFTDYLALEFTSESGHKYNALCHRAVNLSLLGSPCFTDVASLNPRSSILTLSFTPDATDEFVATLKKQGEFAGDKFGVHFQIEERQNETIGDMKSGKWIAYAARALVMRFWELGKVSNNYDYHTDTQYIDRYIHLQKADSLDILLVLVGYILMHVSFIRLFLSSRALGSNFWLTTAVLSSCVLAFLLALPIALYLGIPLDPISLTEALPFLVCTVGFDKPLRFARAVFAHPHLTTAVKDGKWRGQMKPTGELILEAFDRVGNVILRDYALEVAVLLVGANTKVGGLKEFCALAALCLVLDCILLGTFYVAILSVMVEVSYLTFILLHHVIPGVGSCKDRLDDPLPPAVPHLLFCGHTHNTPIVTPSRSGA